MFTNISRTYCTDIYSQSETFVYTNLPVPYLRNLTLYLNVITLCRLPIYLMIDLIFKFDKNLFRPTLQNSISESFL